jgi:hypothetical protein
MAPTSGTALSADAILDYMVKSLPTPPSDAEQKALVKDPYAAIALFSHACMLAVGFRLIGLGEDHKIGRTTVALWVISALTTNRSAIRPSRYSALTRRMGPVFLLRLPLRALAIFDGISGQGEQTWKQGTYICGWLG